MPSISRTVRALLASRALLVKIKRDLENQIRGLLKNLDLGSAVPSSMSFAARAEELIEDRPRVDRCGRAAAQGT